MKTYAKQALRASTLVETLVASVIFMCVFAISLETLSRLTTRDDDNAVLVEADYRVKELFRLYGDGTHGAGEHKQEYDWGTITVRISPYGEYGRVQEVAITADVMRVSKLLEFRHIVEIADGH
ncbi:MAG: hypothetical protein FWE10_07425 [Rikenellaceae bacterium]|nr:hypothetical protein [Rikenellaceae bacterium]